MLSTTADERTRSIRGASLFWISTLTILLTISMSLVILATPVFAASRSMTGSLGVITPSTAPPFMFTAGIAVFGRKVGPFAPTNAFKTLSVAGAATATTFTGRQITIAANELNFSGAQVRDFPAFAGVANLTNITLSVQEAATLMENGGPLAACPGPGCTSAGTGTAISWCPPLAQGANPAPGTAAAQVGNWDCPSWPAGAAGGDRGIRIGITNPSGRPHFGGAFSLLRTGSRTVWRVLVQPGTDGVAEVRRDSVQYPDAPWTPGNPDNFHYQAEGLEGGPRINAMLNANGAVTQTSGCANGVGTVGVGQTYSPGGGQAGLGSNCGTPVTPAPPTSGWGFPLTTGTIEGSDPFPFLSVSTTLGTPLNPNFTPQPASAGFFFSRMGTDVVSGSTRNIVMLGGGVAVDPVSGNSFFRIMDMRMRLQVPEPGVGLALVAGSAALALITRRRRS